MEDLTAGVEELKGGLKNCKETIIVKLYQALLMYWCEIFEKWKKCSDSKELKTLKTIFSRILIL